MAKTTEITQEMMKNARTSGMYENIWTTRGKCVFCDLKDKYILLEENGIVLTISLYPYIDGQMMAIPRRHITSPKELSEIEWDTIRKFNYLAKKLIRKVHGHKGMWTLLREGREKAQMSVSDHLHVHFIPFDDSDLCVWNYRDLEYTPLENVDKYKQAVKKIVGINEKYENRYKQFSTLRVVVDLLALSTDGEVLLQERAAKAAFKNNNLNLPGGHVDTGEDNLLEALKREVKEEMGYELDTTKVELLNSEIGQMEYRNHSPYLGVDLPRRHKFIWNVYLYRGFDKNTKIVSGDDGAGIIWMGPEAVAKSERISPGLKRMINLAFAKNND